MPAISVIVPVYRVEPYLCRCVDSVLSQTYSDFEVILVDDGSPDNCPMICDKYAEKDRRVRVIHQKNGGLSAARNVGLQAAQGQYIAFVDSDDCIHEKLLETLLVVLKETDADFVKSNYIAFSDSVPQPENVPSIITVYTPEEALREFMCTEFSAGKHMKSTAWATLYKREMFFVSEKIVLSFPLGKINEDTYIFPELILRAKKIAHIDAAFYYYFSREDGITRSTVSKREIDSCDLWEYIHAIISQHTKVFEQQLARNSITRYLTVLQRTYDSSLKKPHFYNVRRSLLEDREGLIPQISDIRLKRTLLLIRNYPLYRLLKRLLGKYLY